MLQQIDGETISERHWASQYVGSAFSSGASGPVSYDCWGLVRAVYLYRFGISVDRVICNANSLRDVRMTFGANALYQMWNKVENIQDGDAVLMRQGRFTSHVGLYANVDGGRIVHALPGTGVVAQPINKIEQAGYEIAGFYRHKKRQ